MRHVSSWSDINWVSCALQQIESPLHLSLFLWPGARAKGSARRGGFEKRHGANLQTLQQPSPSIRFLSRVLLPFMLRLPMTAAHFEALTVEVHRAEKLRLIHCARVGAESLKRSKKVALCADPTLTTPWKGSMGKMTARLRLTLSFWSSRPSYSRSKSAKGSRSFSCSLSTPRSEIRVTDASQYMFARTLGRRCISKPTHATCAWSQNCLLLLNSRYVDP